MAAPTNTALVKKVLANSEPSTHGSCRKAVPTAFTRVAACTLALPPIRDTLTKGFSYFVTSIAAPIASGWSVRRVGLAPTGKRRLITAHTHVGHRLTMFRRAIRRHEQSFA